MNWQDAFLDQAQSCAALGSPFTARLLTLLAERGLPEGPVLDRITGWPGDITSRGASLALRVVGALHGLVLEGRAPGLAAAYPPAEGEGLYERACEAILGEAGWINTRLDLPPQTNEVGRSAVPIAAAHWLAAVTGLPMRLSELGASAGLNLNFDHYALAGPGWQRGATDPAITLRPDWTGDAPPRAGLQVTERAGADLLPLNPVRDQLRLLSYVWPDQAERLTRMQLALDLAARRGTIVDQVDAAEFLARRLTPSPDGTLHLVYHTIAWQYFPPATQAQGLAGLEAAGARATRTRPLARLGMEADDVTGSAAVTATLWPGGRNYSLGRADFHGRWIDWQAPRPEDVPW
ncbi:MAG TPA: DUF2332 family protein [Albidovulum sp.]|uniref:DUF2332 domain-containing protein n=1 Tax=Albidovulum sp. TaxID=1872424 RepID=UPI002C795910|nr:DUF2332 family protein [Albidovulum sp.]